MTMQESATTPAVANPLTRLAATIPARLAVALSVIARLVGAGLAPYYAYDQDVLFPDRHFPRTWVLASVVAAVAVLSTIPIPAGSSRARWLALGFAAAGAGMLIFGGANLANKAPGVGALVCGVVAWLMIAVAASNRGQSQSAVVAGLAVAAVVTFGVVGLCVVAVSGSA
jgi:hypothetical protein